MKGVDFDAYIDAVSGAVGLTIAPEYRPGVAGFLKGAAELAALLEQVPLDDAELVLAPVFRLPGSDDG